jgi:hypothetical protein
VVIEKISHVKFTYLSIRMPKRFSSSGWSKMHRCRAPEVLRSEANFTVRCNDEGGGERRRWVFFNSLLLFAAPFVNKSRMLPPVILKHHVMAHVVPDAAVSCLQIISKRIP